MSLSEQLKKAHGAYYTREEVADFLTAWAIRTPHDRVLDPSAGAGVFLKAAVQQLSRRGGSGASQVLGIELLPETCKTTSRELDGDGYAARLFCRDFFETTSSDFGAVDAVVGNPPFIRYQRFAGQMRKRALERAEEAGVRISALTSSWAPFLVHAVSFLRPGGRLAMVAPAELGHAAYAQRVLQYLCDSFRTVIVLAFERRLFADLSEDTVLVLADDKGGRFESFTLHSLSGPEHLSADNGLGGGVRLDARGVSSGAVRMIEYLLPARIRQLYQEIRTHRKVRNLGALADVGIGYVTGANDFFHLSFADANLHGIPKRYLARAVRRGSDFVGLMFSDRDWESLAEKGAANLLLRIRDTEKRLPASLQRYLERGIAAGINQRYKCRTREPWYAVPHVHEADGFLTYMSGGVPRLVVNGARAVAPNTLHVIRMRPASLMSVGGLATAWQSSLTWLSCEIEGHSLGGGLLKLEPTEAERVLVPMLGEDRFDTERLDRQLRDGSLTAVLDEVDSSVARTLGLARADLRKLCEGAKMLRERRSSR